MIMVKERIVVSDDDPFGRLDVEREPVPQTGLIEWAGTGPARGAYEEAVEAEYIAPSRAA
jgi:hypothetical protein